MGKGEQLGRGTWSRGPLAHQLDRGVEIAVGENEVAHSLIEVAELSPVDTDGKESGERLFREVRVIEDEKICRLDLRTRVEVGPIIHCADGSGVVIRGETGWWVVLC